MDRVEEIEAAITNLPPDEYRRLVEWFREREQTRWDEQLDRDSIAGKLDFLFREAQDDPGQDGSATGRPQREVGRDAPGVVPSPAG